jgi:RNA-directed DNA polymerase
VAARRLPKSLSESELRTVWKDSRDSRVNSAGAAGVDGVSATDFSKRLIPTLHQTRQAIRLGHFAFSPLRVCTVPKKNGGKRIIAVPTIRDRLVQRAICRHLENDKRFPKPPSVAYGFVKNRSLEDAHNKALEFRRKSPWILQTDIVAFFDRISRDDVIKAVTRTVRSKVISDLIIMAAGTELDYSDPLTSVLTKESGLRRGRGLRQGMPLSPVLSNLVMRDVDRSLEKAKLQAIRYADDIVVFCDSEVGCIEALRLIESLLEPFGLKLPPLDDTGKTTITPARKSCEVLGVELRLINEHYEICAPSSRLATLESHFAEIATAEYCVANKLTLTRMLAHLDAVARGHKRTVHRLKNAGDFQARVESIQKKSVESLIKSLVGEKAFANLTHSKLAVLGVRAF